MFILQLSLIGICIALIPLGWVWLRSGADRFGQLVWVTTILTFDLVLFGSFTRLTDSGLGCPDWPGCYGAASPFIAHEAIQAAQAALPSGPVTMVKAWIEMMHRYLALALGVLMIAQVVVAWRSRKVLPVSPWWPVALLILICVQGAFGAWTVTLKLQPIIVTIHLLLGLTLLGALAWLAMRCTPSVAPEPAATRWRWAVWIGLALLVVQIALGGWVSANYAVLACTDFPTCHGAWLPPMDFAQGFQLWRALGQTKAGDFITQDALVAIHWTHRNFAWLVSVWLLGLGLRLRQFNALRPLANGLMALVALQGLTGIANILLQWPLLIALVHNGGAALLLLLLIMLNYRIAINRQSVRRTATKV
ncbi:heme A synthase [Mycoavidus sp. B2-EB]|uniref:COX15/CtaA family protein n=1 Tax=Mycoavidus sp. B2-EB TaxID=2651972 RepID=UPI0016237973|nr:COX15/CtaA family protein [Mycoavidus sp. B2-EB]BBO60363.1 cytochrome c oxidase subunit I [Mycoavidus sp. B2-EB]